MAKPIMGLFFGIVIVFLGLGFAKGQDTVEVILFGMGTAVVLTTIINKFIGGASTEIFVSAFILGIMDSYIFLIQDNLVNASTNLFGLFSTPITFSIPQLPGSFELFFGAASITRALVLMATLVPSPIQKPVKNLLSG